ncbi:MAG: hypothetical protein COV74_10725 [Candidatus Omnitrophica bacterium CG11_big_fil_rev_8_21_14_0_20_45_26]|uniref:Rubrerythrin diiron-binding domain-containing protein n=1 Tax=Candidatus Abzuiibacterium crystallinum TaxID=1974748 RepID=A0A2H0LKW9_9BACT|nr:MAG: hypothetical protein COV74_10725 [Candidatus Omnitrophica bacterium CG11_big_fil_rev_8_21_14_0_20_45_26]PIW63861.1 MAG: hypothetical protein COW12_08085 [Candidatus Omnitrophica bacterium CG12_big_fil_rev_8_21_14_0_65_45_16]
MHDEHLKQLWTIRFRKIVNLEKEAYRFYQGLLAHYPDVLEGTKTKKLLEQIMKDEAKHAKIAHQLLQLVKRKQITSHNATDSARSVPHEIKN